MSAMNEQVLVSAQTVAKLKPCLPRLSLFILWFELDVLSRLIYNGKSKHRQDMSFQKLTGVFRRLKKYKPVSKCLVMSCERLAKAIDTRKEKAVQNCVRVGKEERLLVRSILESATFIADLIHFTEDTWREVHHRLIRNVFISFNVLLLSCLSRIWYCLRFHLLGLADTYHVLLDILPDTSLPGNIRDHLKEPFRKYLATHTSGQPTSDSTLRMEIAGGPGLSQGDVDTGVAVVLNEAEQLARLKNTSAPSGLHLHGNLNLQPATPPESDLDATSAAELRLSHVMPPPHHVRPRSYQSSSVPNSTSSSKRNCAGSVRERKRLRWIKARLYLLNRRRMGKLAKGDVIAMLPQREYIPTVKEKPERENLKKKPREKSIMKKQDENLKKNQKEKNVKRKRKEKNLKKKLREKRKIRRKKSAKGRKQADKTA